MDIESGLKLPAYTDTEIIMDDESISVIDFMSRFEKFKVDEISIDEAEDDICFNAKEWFEDSRVISLIGLRYTEDENINEWGKRNWNTLQLSLFQLNSMNYWKVILPTSVLFSMLYIRRISTKKYCLSLAAHIFLLTKTTPKMVF